jgi:hypothetical protein
LFGVLETELRYTNMGTKTFFHGSPSSKLIPKSFPA